MDRKTKSVIRERLMVFDDVIVKRLRPQNEPGTSQQNTETEDSQWSIKEIDFAEHHFKFVCEEVDFKRSVAEDSNEIMMESIKIEPDKSLFPNDLQQRDMAVTVIDWIVESSSDNKLLVSLKCQITKDKGTAKKQKGAVAKEEEREERYVIFVYDCKNEIWIYVTQGKFDGGSFLGHKSDAIALKDKNKIKIYKQEKNGIFNLAREKEFAESQGQIIFLLNWFITKVEVIPRDNLNDTRITAFLLEIYKYDAIQQDLLDHSNLKFYIGCNYEYPIISGLSNLLLSPVPRPLTEDANKIKNTFSALVHYHHNGKHNNQSTLQFLNLQLENETNCIFWLNHWSFKIPRIYLSTVGKTGLFSREGDLIAILNENDHQLQIWDVDILINNPYLHLATCRHFSGLPLYKLPDPMCVDISQKRVIMFESIAIDRHNGILKIVTLYDDMSFAVWQNDNKENSKLYLLLKLSSCISQICNFSFNGEILVLIGKNEKNQKFTYLYLASRGECIRKLPYEHNESLEQSQVVLDRQTILYKDDQSLRMLDFKCTNSIWGISYKSNKNSLSMLRLSPTGRYLVFKMSREVNGNFKDYLGYLSVGKNKGHIVYDTNVRDLFFSEDDKYLLCLNQLGHLHIADTEKNTDIKHLVDISKYDYDVTGNFEKTSTPNNSDLGIHYSTNQILSVIAKDNEKNDICIMTCDTKSKSMTFQKSVILNMREWLYCNWDYSSNRHKIIFYFSNAYTSKTVVWHCDSCKVININNFGFTLLKPKMGGGNGVGGGGGRGGESYGTPNYDFGLRDFCITDNGNKLVIKSYSENSLFCASFGTSQETIDKLIIQKNQYFTTTIKKVKIVNENHLYTVEENAKTRNLTVYYAKIDMIPGSLLEKIESSAIFLSFNIPHYVKYDAEDSEKFLVSANHKILAFISTEFHVFGKQRKFRLKCLLWNPISAVYRNILDYSCMKFFKDEQPGVGDIQHILKKEVIEKVDTSGRSLLMVAVKDKNSAIVQQVIDWSVQNGHKVRYVCCKDNPRCRTLRDEDLNAIQIAINNRDRILLDILVKAILANTVDLMDTVDVIDECKNDLLHDYKELYLSLVRCVLVNEDLVKFPGAAFKENGYLTLTVDSPETPKWLVELHKKSKGINDLQSEVISVMEEYIDAVQVGTSQNLESYIDLIRNMSASNTLKYSSMTMRVKDIDKQFKIIEAKSVIFPWKNAASIGDDSLLNTLQTNNFEWETFNAFPIKTLINHKWDTYGRIYTFWSLFYHLLLLLLFQIYAILLGAKLDNKNIVLSKYIFLFMAGAICIFNLACEIVQFYRILFKKGNGNSFKEGFHNFISNWFFSKWNLFEFLMYINVIFVLPILHYKKESDEYSIALNSIASITCCLIWWKLLYFFLPFRPTGPLILMIFEIIKDVGFFITVLVMILLGFSTSFFVLFQGQDEHEKEIFELFGNYPKSLLTTFSMMLGNFDPDVFYDSDSPVVSTFLFVLFMMIVLLVLINLLIAIMGDSYDRVKSKEEISFLIARAQVIQDIETKLFDFQQRKLNEKMNKTFFHILYPKEGIDSVRWLGKVEEITNNVKTAIETDSTKLEMIIGKQNQNLEEQLSQLSRTIEEMEINMKNQIEDKFSVMFEKFNITKKDEQLSSAPFFQELPVL